MPGDRLWGQNLCHPVLPKAVSHTVAVWLSIAGGLPRLRFADLLEA